MPRHLRKCQNYDISANIYTPEKRGIMTKSRKPNMRG
jgi:hypothetical protein